MEFTDIKPDCSVKSMDFYKNKTMNLKTFLRQLSLQRVFNLPTFIELLCNTRSWNENF